MDAKTGSCEHQQIPSRTQNFSVIIGSKLDRVNRPLDNSLVFSTNFLVIAHFKAYVKEIQNISKDMSIKAQK